MAVWEECQGVPWAVKEAEKRLAMNELDEADREYQARRQELARRQALAMDYLTEGKKRLREASKRLRTLEARIQAMG